jgi:benzoylsuccinyl-CoA thiolase BbsB subunit
MREVAIIGVGSTVFGKFPERLVKDMGSDAVWAAIEDANISPKDIQVAYAATSFGANVVGERLLSTAGIADIEVNNVENACVGGANAFRGAWWAVASGLYDIALAVGVESMTTTIAGKLITPEPNDLNGDLGNNSPAHFAMSMRRHMEKYGTTLEHFAQVSVKNHRNGCLNPYSQYKKELTIEEILNSRMIVDPITLLQCCPNTDGASAAILVPLSMAKKYTNKKPITVMASVMTMGGFEHNWKELAISEMSTKAAKKAYEIAACGPEDIDVCECHDAFAYCEIAHYEELALCPAGEGGRFVMEGKADINGDVAVNPSGGLLSRGHPVAATGIMQIAEIVWQLRGEAGKRQVPRARIGLAHTVGGEVATLESGTVAIHILKA